MSSGLCGQTQGSRNRIAIDQVKFELKSLILAQIERWRHALHMQVERERGQPRVEWRTGEQYIGTFPVAGDNLEKSRLIPHTIYG